MPRTTTNIGRRTEAQRLSRLRDAGGLTQRQLAEAFRVGQSTVAQWEAGERTIPGPALVLIELYEQHVGLLPKRAAQSRVDETPEPSRLARGVASAQAAALWLALSGADSFMPASIAKHAQTAATRQFVKTVGNLKGLAMKLAQMSVHGDYVLPEEQRRLLAEMQASAKPMPAGALLDVLLSELGATPKEVFAEWSAEPVAVASIGQVHRATTRSGLDVAVKVQFPKAVATLKADIENVRILGRVAALALPAQRAGVIYEEVRARLLEECDYRIEATRMQDFRERFRGRSDMVIPAVVEASSTERVLTSSWIDGQTLDAFAASASEAERSRAGAAIWDFYCESFFMHSCFHADPHPGNILVTANGVAFLDFGRVKVLPEESRRLSRASVRALAERDPAALRRVLIAFGCVPNPDDYDFFYAYRLMLQVHRGFFVDEPFEYTGDVVAKTWRMFTSENVNRQRSHFPADIIFMSQIFFGVTSLLARLHAPVQCRETLLACVYDPGEARPPAFTREEFAALGL